MKTIKPKDKLFNKDDAINSCYDWILSEFATWHCRRPPGSSNPDTACNCMMILASSENSALTMQAAKYMVHWAGLSRKMKREIIYEWAKVACSFLSSEVPTDKLVYMLPTLIVPEKNILICRNGLTGLLDIGRVAWRSAIHDRDKQDPKKDKLGDLSSRGKNIKEIYNSLNVFFLVLATEGLPFATRIIHEETGMTLRDDDPDEVVLAPHITKQ